MMSLRSTHVSPFPLKFNMPQSNEVHAQSKKKVRNNDYVEIDVEHDPNTMMVGQYLCNSFHQRGEITTQMCPLNLKCETPQTRMQCLIDTNPNQEDNEILVVMNHWTCLVNHQKKMNGHVE